MLPGRGGPTAPSWTPPPPPRVLVFGDSYAAGHGASPATAGFAYQLRGSLGWDVTVDGVGGSGDPATGNHGEGSYLTRLARAAPGPFDLVLLQGGSNDEHQPVERLEPAVAATVTAASKRYPGAQVALMGPVALYGVVPPEKAAVHGVLERYATTAGLTFLDPIDEGWFVRGDAKTMADRATSHPNNAGYGRIRTASSTPPAPGCSREAADARGARFWVARGPAYEGDPRCGPTFDASSNARPDACPDATPGPVAAASRPRATPSGGSSAALPAWSACWSCWPRAPRSTAAR